MLERGRLGLRDLTSRIEKIPVLKLPPSWFGGSLGAILDSDGTRWDADRRVLKAFPGHDTKLSMRAFAVPTLTRLQFVRASPGFLLPAPNGLLWKDLPVDKRSPFIGLCVRDLLVLQLGLSPTLVRAEHLAAIGKELGKPYRDRLAGLVRLLRRFPPPDVAGCTDAVSLSVVSARPQELDSSHARKLLREDLAGELKGRDIVRLDDLRVGVMRSLLAKGRIVSSFMVDWVLLSFMSKSEMCIPAASATTRLGGLVVGRKPFDAVQSLVSE
jgi:hypothetical protein